MSAPLPHLSTADLAPHVEAINRLADAGWSVCMNQLGPQWHVGIAHASDTRLEHVVHARSRLLGHALKQAIDEAESTPIPT